MSPSPRGRGTTSMKRRAPLACVFCRQRKIKCTSERPTCSNCNVYQRTCVYDDSIKRARPSNARIAELEEENRRLQASLTHISPDDQSESFDHATKHSGGSQMMSPDSQSMSYARSMSDVPTQSPDAGDDNASSSVHTLGVRNRNETAASDPTGYLPEEDEPRYYGPTSALHNDASRFGRLQPSITRPNVPVELVQKGLIAEAAQQRHLEIINMRAEKLDFDGVDPELGMHLLSLHWNRQHHSFLITYRPALMRDMACGGPYFSKLLLNAIYFGVSKFSSRPEVRRDPADVRTAGWLFRQRFKKLLGEELDKSKITTIQALLVMTSSLFALGDERSAAWLYAGMAFRMIVDLGLHLDAPLLPNFRQPSDENLEIRRRVFWGAFVVDKLHSLYQGRPVSLQETEMRVPITFLDQYEELEPWKPYAYSETNKYPGSPAFSVSTFTQLCKLSVIMNRILNKIYAERSVKRNKDELASDLETLHEEIEQWRQDLPAHLIFNPGESTQVQPPPPHVLSLLAMHNVLLILLHRPFVSDGHLHSRPSSVAINSFLVCANAANEITNLIRTYDDAFSIRRAPYLMSYATYVSATIHVRIAAQRDSGSEAHTCLRTCLNVFQENQETNWAVRRADFVIRNLMKRMNVVVEDCENHTSTSVQDRHAGSPGNLDELTTMTATVPTAAVQGNVSADLDIDAIIQSFIREQQIQDAGRFGSFDYQMDASRNSIPGQTTLGMQGCQQYGDLHGGAGSSYVPSLASKGLVDDMLFGFNSSAVDKLDWELEDWPFVSG